MKQKHLIIIPIVTLSFLVSCNNKSLFKSSPGTLFTVIFDSKGGSPTPAIQAIEAGKQASEPEENPTKDGCTFGGWYTDKEATEYKYDFSSPVMTNLTLYAKWDREFATVTFDATENGKFEDTTRYVCFSAPVGTKLYPYINIMKEFEPASKGQTFAYYSYKDSDAIIDYEDTIDGNITLEANYLSGVPYSNLDGFSWNFIKQVAVTKKDPSEVFKIGATKTVDLYNQSHKVRIIGYNHDKLASDANEDIKTGLTFEFANLITKENGEVYYTLWNPGSANINRFVTSNLNTLLNGKEGYEGDCILNDLPSDLTKVMQLVAKQAGKGGSKVYDSEPYTAKLFPLARAEMTNSHIEQEPLDEGTQYEYYKGHDTYTEPIRKKAGVGKNVETDSKEYWLRSPCCKSYDYTPDDVFKVYESGILTHWDMYDTDHGFAPAFCI